MKYLRNEDEAKDCVQQVFLKAIDELHKYKVQYIRSWLYQIAKNQCLMKLRGQKGKWPLELQEIAAPAAEEANDFTAFVEKDRLLDLLAQGLTRLNNDQKQCVQLFYLEKKSYQDITALTGFTLMQVKSHIQNGKRNLRNFLQHQSSNTP